MKGTNKITMNNVTVCAALTEYFERRRLINVGEKQIVEYISAHGAPVGDFVVTIKEVK